MGNRERGVGPTLILQGPGILVASHKVPHHGEVGPRGRVKPILERDQILDVVQLGFPPRKDRKGDKERETRPEKGRDVERGRGATRDAGTRTVGGR